MSTYRCEPQHILPLALDWHLSFSAPTTFFFLNHSFLSSPSRNLRLDVRPDHLHRTMNRAYMKPVHLRVLEAIARTSFVGAWTFDIPIFLLVWLEQDCFEFRILLSFSLSPGFGPTCVVLLQQNLVFSISVRYSPGTSVALRFTLPL